MFPRTLMAAWAWLLVPAQLFSTAALGAPKEPAPPAPTSLCEESLRAGRQGQAGIALDLNGDGNDDLVIGAPYAQHKKATGALLFYVSNARGFTPRPSAVLEGSGNLGWSLVGLGDVDRDGKADFAAGAFSGSDDEVSLAGTVTLFLGGQEPKALSVLSGENALDKFGYALAAGDLNGDGYRDLVVGAPFHCPSPSLYQRGAVYVYAGPRFDPATAVKIPATSANGGIGFSVAAGDINGDGLDDLLLQATGKVIAYYGGTGFFVANPQNPGQPGNPDVVFTSTDAGFGRAIAVLWDVNRDGFRDVAVGAEQATIDNVIDSGRVFILAGGTGTRTVNADVASPQRLARIDGEPNCGRFGSVVLPVGDVDRDGTPDLAVSAVHGDGNPWPVTGKIFILSGNTLTEGPQVVTAIPGQARDMHLGSFLAWVPKRGLLAAGAPTEKANTGRVRLFDLR